MSVAGASTVNTTVSKATSETAATTCGPGSASAGTTNVQSNAPLVIGHVVRNWSSPAISKRRPTSPSPKPLPLMRMTSPGRPDAGFRVSAALCNSKRNSSTAVIGGNPTRTEQSAHWPDRTRCRIPGPDEAGEPCFSSTVATRRIKWCSSRGLRRFGMMHGKAVTNVTRPELANDLLPAARAGLIREQLRYLQHTHQMPGSNSTTTSRH